MTTKTPSVLNELYERIQRGVDAGEEMDTDFLVDSILANHPDVMGADADWYVINTRNNVRENARKVLRRFKRDNDDPAESQAALPLQLTMEGFDFLQKSYGCVRQGRHKIVPADQMSRGEWLEKLREWKSGIDGWILHYDEARRYFRQRFGEEPEA